MMRRIKNVLPMLFLALVPLVSANAFQITITPDATYANFANFPLWSSTLFPELAKIATPLPVTTLSLAVNPAGEVGYDTIQCPNTVLWGPTPPYNDGFNTVGPNAFDFLHESNHVRTCGWLGRGLLGEGYTQAVAYGEFYLAHQTNPSALLGASSAGMEGLRRHYNPKAIGGESDFYAQGWYDHVSGQIEKITGGYYKDIDNVLYQWGTTIHQGIFTWQDQVRLLDSLPDFQGSKPSDYVLGSPIAYFNGPDGQFLWIEPIQYNISDASGNQIFREDNPVYNDRGQIDWELKERTNGVGKTRNDGLLYFAVLEYGTKRVMTSGTSDYNAPPGFGGGLIDPTNWPDGGYQVAACWAAPGTACDPLNADPNNPDLWATTYIAVLRNLPSWWTHKTFVFEDGANNEFGNEHLTVTGGSATATELPGLLVIDYNGSLGSVTVSDGVRSKLYEPVYRNSAYLDSSFAFERWTGRDNLLAVTTGSDYAPGKLTPGQLTVAWGSNFTPNPPTPAVTTPLPTTLDNIQVFVRSGGVDFPAPLYFVSSGQINFQVPGKTPPGFATVRVVINGVASNPLYVEVTDSRPSVFETGNGQPVATSLDGQLVSSSNQPRAGDVIIIYGTGLGNTNPGVEDGCADPGVAWANIPVTVSIGGVQAQVLYAGLAPTFVGVDQINVVIPDGVAGLTPLLLGSATATYTVQGMLRIAQ